MEQGNQSFNGNIFGVFLFILAIAMVIGLAFAIVSFKNERDYIKMEIMRSTKEKERKYWEEELRKLYIRKIPIIGDLLLDDDD